MTERAVEAHPSIAAAPATARAAGADVRAARWQRFPSFSVEGLLLDQPGNAMQAQAVVDQPLRAVGRIPWVINRANARDDWLAELSSRSAQSVKLDLRNGSENRSGFRPKMSKSDIQI